MDKSRPLRTLAFASVLLSDLTLDGLVGHADKRASTNLTLGNTHDGLSD
jgi:hypothetical protein